MSADAADITQEVFLQVFRSVRSFHGESSLRTWLYRIALHEASNQRRWWRRHKQQEVTLDTPAENAEDDSPTLASILATHDAAPFDLARESELRTQLEAALRDLPDSFRSVVILREIEGFSYEEIADVLKLQLGTVKSRLTRGRTLLRDALTRHRRDITAGDPTLTHLAGRSARSSTITSSHSSRSRSPAAIGLSASAADVAKPATHTRISTAGRTA